MDSLSNPELRLVGGHPALDLVNTVAPRIPGGAGHTEYVGTPDELLGWAVRAGVVDATEATAVRSAWSASPASAEQALHAAVDIREAVYEVLTAVLGATSAARPRASSALERLSLRWATAAARSELVFSGGDGPAVRLSVGTTPVQLIADRLAHAAVDLLRTADVSRLRVCPVADGGCGWVFVDHSRNGSRRWCAMADCGAQAKARRLTARRREARPAGDGS